MRLTLKSTDTGSYNSHFLSHDLTITGSLLDQMLIITAINRRFEAKFKVPLPNKDGRKMILKYELKGNIVILKYAKGN